MTLEIPAPVISQPSPPRCPGCGRAIAAWRLDHCVYCGAAFPAELKASAPPPEALQWIERPALPPDAARQIELLKVVPSGGEKRSRSLPAAISLLSLPVFGVLFYLLYRLASRFSPFAAEFVAAAGAVFVLYLGYAVFRSRSTGL